MTTPLSSTAIRGELAVVSKALEKAREDAALYARLTAAKAEVTRLVKLGDELTATLDKALADEAKKERDDLFAQFDGIRVSVSFPKDWQNSVISARYIITYKRLSYDSGLHQSVMKEFTADGFQTLKSDAYRYLVEAHPEQIPDIIMQLAPGEPALAIARYLQAMRRGYVVRDSQ